MSTDLDPDDLTHALHARVASVHPDLEHLIAVATRQGTRIRRVRRAGISLTAIAGLGAVGAFAGSMAVGTAPAPQASDVAAGPPVATVTPAADPDCEDFLIHGSAVVQPPSADGVVTAKELRDLIRFKKQIGAMPTQAVLPAAGEDAITVKELRGLDCPPPRATQAPPAQDPPVRLELAGWTCGPAADEKMECAAASRSVLVVWRPGSEHDSWTSDPDKTAAYVSKVHAGWFVSVDPGHGASARDAVAVGHALRWVD